MLFSRGSNVETFWVFKGRAVTGKIQTVKRVDTAFDGLDPNGLDYLIRSADVELTQPLVAGATQTIISLQVPPHLVWDISGVEFFGTIEVGGGFAEVPDDYVRNSIVYRILKNDAAFRNNVSLIFVGAALVPTPFNGSDILNRNILALLGSTPGHLIFGGSSTLKVEVEVVNALLPVPLGFRVGVRFAGREIQQDKWEDMAR